MDLVPFGVEWWRGGAGAGAAGKGPITGAIVLLLDCGRLLLGPGAGSPGSDSISWTPRIPRLLTMLTRMPANRQWRQGWRGRAAPGPAPCAPLSVATPPGRAAQWGGGPAASWLAGFGPPGGPPAPLLLPMAGQWYYAAGSRPCHLLRLHPQSLVVRCPEPRYATSSGSTAGAPPLWHLRWHEHHVHPQIRWLLRRICLSATSCWAGGRKGLWCVHRWGARK